VNLLLKIYQKSIRVASQLVFPRAKRRIIHSFLPSYEMLVFANEDVGRQIWLFGNYEADETRFFIEQIRPTDICFDVGGNVGYFSLLMSRLASDGSVHVFEPIPVNAALIAANTALNAIENLHLTNAAVGDHEGSVLFSVSVDSAYSSMHATGRLAEEKSIHVPLIALDDYLSAKSLLRIDVMKVDVEGAEDLVIRGASGLLGDSSRRPRIVLMELFDGNLSSFGSSVASVIERMASFGYQPHVLMAGGRRLAPYNPSRHSAFYNIIFLSTAC
jgi:FkbM family methyltransferase